MTIRATPGCAKEVEPARRRLHLAASAPFTSLLLAGLRRLSWSVR